MSRNRVRWEEVDAGVFEQMVAVLISRLHREAQRIDGSGGDEGRDVHLPLPTGLEIFELKSFTGRMTSKRRTQVKKSLKRASDHKPCAWHLVVPIDPTPTELRWFEDLSATFPFPCDWRGLAWLDGNMAAHLDIPRYYIEGSAEEILNLLQEISREEAALSRGVPDAADRQRALTARLNTIDPHYGFGLASQPDGSVTITAFPKYPGAELDRPIKISGSFAFPDTGEGRAAAASFQQTLDYGVPGAVTSEYVKALEIDAPAGFGGAWEGGELRFGIAEDSVDEDSAMDLKVLDENGRTIGQLPLKLRKRMAGARGGELRFVDFTGAVTVTTRFDVPTRHMKLNYTYSRPAGAVPGQLLPAVRFLARMRPGHQLLALLGGKEIAPPMPIPHPGHGDAARHEALLQALVRIQDATSVVFPFPEDLTDEELEGVRNAVRLLEGETLTGTWSELTITTTAAGIPALREGEVGIGESGPVVMEGELSFNLAGYDLPLGRSRKTYASARVKEWPNLPAGVSPDQPIDLTLVTGNDKSMSWSLVQ